MSGDPESFVSTPVAAAARHADQIKDRSHARRETNDRVRDATGDRTPTRWPDTIVAVYLSRHHD